MKGIVTLLLLAISATSYAQSNAGALKGMVKNEDGEVLEMASVSVQVGDRQNVSYTDASGKFTIKPLSAGTYVLTVRYNGMHDQVIQFDVTTDRITFLNDIVLVSSNNLKPVDIIATEPLINPDDPNKMTLKRKEVLMSAGLRDMSMLLTTMDSGIKKGDNGELYFRGGRSGGVVTFIDGVKVGTTVANIPGRAIGNVSVYTGGVPAKYGDTTSGVVVLETVSYFDLFYSQQ